MKLLSRTYLPPTIVTGGKKYIQDYSFNQHSKVNEKHLQVVVQSIRAKELNVDPKVFIFIEVKTPLDVIVRPLNGSRGAPMGRANIGGRPDEGGILDCYLPMSCEAYDKGGAYWGVGSRMRVSYTKDLSYVEYYRELIAVA